MVTDAMRQLHIIPIVHSRHDLGTLEQPIREAKERFIPSSTIDQNQNVLDSFWDALKTGIESWSMDWSRTFVFQDALPYTGHPERIIEHKIVADLAAKGSANHKLVMWLIENGATLVGTESTDLLIKEYEAVKKSLAEGAYRDTTSSDQQGSAEPALALLQQRDQFIAQRISDTLREEQIGILFIGLQHQVQAYLPQDIKVDYPFGKAKERTRPRIFEASA